MRSRRPVPEATRNAPPAGYRVVPKDALEPVNGGLRLSSNVLMNKAGCWHCRVRNTKRGPDRPYWLWIQDQDPTSIRRYRNRAWLSGSGTQVPSGCTLGTSCGDPHCISPYHLTISARPYTPYRPREGGRYGWIGEGEDAYWGWIPDAPKRQRKAKASGDPAARPRSGPKPRPKPEPKGHAKGAQHWKAKLTEDDVRAIRSAQGVTQAALAERYGVSAVSICRIIARKTWTHVPD